MSFLLDTNIVSEASKPLPSERCLAWLHAHRGKCQLSTITLAELSFGVERMPNGKRKSAAKTRLDFLAQDYAGRFLEFDGSAATEWGRYAAELEAHFGMDWWKQFDLRDTQIAAIAREYGLTLVTRNTRDFPFVKTENPFV